MPYQPYAVTHHKARLRSKAVAANIEELPFLESSLARLDTLLALLPDLEVQQASLTARRQEVSKQIAEATDEAQKLLTFLDAAVKQHYGRSSEKLAEFGLQPFRSKPRTRRVGPDAQPLEQNAAAAEPPASPETE